MANLTLICLQCQIPYRVSLNGVYCELQSSRGAYQVWYGDLFECPSCGSEVVGNFPDHPLLQCHDPSQAELLESLRREQPYLRVWSSQQEKEVCRA